MQQLQGLVDGYQQFCMKSKYLTRLQMLMTNLDGDLFDIIPAFIPQSMPKRNHGHCTSFVRFTQNELYCAHNTWDGYQTMVRIFKHYNFPSSDPNVAATLVSMSSYPGVISSLDDFYILSSGLYVTETTNGNFNMTLYKLLTPKSVMSWLRTVVANSLAFGAGDWTELYSKYNSGTYNNQWVIVDHNLFTPGMVQLSPGTVWIAEQIPGYVERGDVTDFVNQNGYWGGYNVPYFDYIFNIMDYPSAVEQYGQEYSWGNCSRANIFRRDAPNVMTIEDMKVIMQYNEYETDPLSGGNPCNAIAARCDLPPVFDAFGAEDAKVTSHEWMAVQRAWATSGPSHQNLPPFQWLDRWDNETHLGQPTLWNFDWQQMSF